MAKRNKPAERVHDRRATDIPINAKIAPIDVEDPLWVKGRDDPKDRMIVTVRSLRDDRLAWLHSHKHIDDAQFHAGRKMQALYEHAGIEVRAMDPTKEPVDGRGELPDTITERMTAAIKEIGRIEGILGREGAAYARDFLAFGNSILQCATSRGAFHESGRIAIAYRIREILETLAVEFGLVSK